MIETLGELPSYAARKFGDRVALVAGGREFSFRDIDALSSALANSLVERSVAPGDRVTLYAPNSWEWIVTYYGALKAGAIINPINVMLTAAEVAYVTAQLGSTLLGIELGNACDAYGSSFYAGNWSVEIFEMLWQQYRSAIVAVTPGAYFAGPAAASDLDSWTLPFGEYVTNREIGLLTQQYDGGPASAASLNGLISANATLAAELLSLREGGQSIGVPFRLDSVSSADGDGALGVSNTYGSALWAIDTVFQAALGGAAGLNFLSGGQQANATISDTGRTILGARPAYYGLLLASMAGAGTLLGTQLSAGGLNVTAYSVQSASGGLSLVLVNKEGAQSLDVRIELPQAMAVATLQQLTQLSVGAAKPDLAAVAGISIQGGGVEADGGFQPNAAYSLALSAKQLSCYVPALSAVIIRLT